MPRWSCCSVTCLLIAAALAAVGLFHHLCGTAADRRRQDSDLGHKSSPAWIGAVQGVCLPFRGFSRSGATISTGLVLGVAKDRLEEFSFALAVVLTPPVIWQGGSHDCYRPIQFPGFRGPAPIALFYPSLVGMVLSFVSGILALKWLSRWLEQGLWQLFGFYCLFFAAVVFWLYLKGY